MGKRKRRREKSSERERNGGEVRGTVSPRAESGRQLDGLHDG